MYVYNKVPPQDMQHVYICSCKCKRIYLAFHLMDREMLEVYVSKI
jgi:hypothetical protein